MVKNVAKMCRTVRNDKEMSQKWKNHSNTVRDMYRKTIKNQSKMLQKMSRKVRNDRNVIEDVQKQIKNATKCF